MNRDDIIKMAREAGLWPAVTDVFPKELERFAALVAAAEREACAKVADDIASKMYEEGEGPTGYIGYVKDCAAGIRERMK